MTRFSEYEKQVKAAACENERTEAVRAAVSDWYAKATHRYASRLKGRDASLRAFDESKVKRDGGKFATHEGAGAKPKEASQGGPPANDEGGGQAASSTPEDAESLVRSDPAKAKAVFKSLIKKEGELTDEEYEVAGGIAIALSNLDEEQSMDLREFNQKTPKPDLPKLSLNEEYAKLPVEASFQKETDFEALFAQVEKTQTLFQEMADLGEGISKRLGSAVADFHANPAEASKAKAEWMKNPKGTIVIIAPPKEKDTALAKVQNRMDGDVRMMNDLVRGTVGVSSYDEAQIAYDAILAEAKERGWTVARQKDNMTGKIGGYRDLNLRLRAANGHVVEMQINSAAMLKAKDKAHDIYKVSRKIGPKIDDGVASEKLGQLWGRMRVRTSQMYGYALRNSFPNRKSRQEKKAPAPS